MVSFQVLSEADKDLVHQRSLLILEQLGVKLQSRKALDMLKSRGCMVDEENSVVKFPAKLVEAALASAPKKFKLGALDPKNDMFLGEGNIYTTTDGQGCFVYDHNLKARRESTMKDLVDAARIMNELDYIKCFWPIVTANDAEDSTRTIAEFVRCMRVSGKHYQTDCFSEAQAKYYIKVLETMLGSRENVIERKIFSVVCCPVSPLSLEPEMIEGCLALAEADVPIVVLPMPISGTTSPMSLLGTVIQNNAEVLAALTVFQLNKPGSPVIYGAAPGVLDMATALFCVGSPEGALQGAACNEMAKRYGLPSLISTVCTEAKEPDMQCGREKATMALTVAMTRPDLFCGVGLVDTANILYPEVLVMDEDVVGYALRVASGINGGEENALTDSVFDVGIGGDYLSEESTVAYLRNGEHYFPTATSRQSYDMWSTAPDGRCRDKAIKKAEEILSMEEKIYLADDIMDKLEKILAEAAMKGV